MFFFFFCLSLARKFLIKVLDYNENSGHWLSFRLMGIVKGNWIIPQIKFFLSVLFFLGLTVFSTSCLNLSLRFFFFKNRLQNIIFFLFFISRVFAIHLERNKQKWSFAKIKNLEYSCSIHWCSDSQIFWSQEPFTIPPPLKNICLFLAAWDLSWGMAQGLSSCSAWA